MAFPWMVSSILELHERAARLKDQQLRTCFTELRRGGATHVRNFITWTNAMDLHPFKRISDGRFDLDLENEAWDASVRRYLRLLREPEDPPPNEFARKRLEAMFSLFDACGLNDKYNCNVWGNNKQGFGNFYLSTDNFMKYAFRWVDRCLALFGAKRTPFELFNEARIPFWLTDKNQAAAWVKEMVVPIFWRIHKANNGKPIAFSGHEPRMEGYTGDTDGTTSRILGNFQAAGIPGNKVVVSVHGIGTPAIWEKIKPFLSAYPRYMISDDGVDTQEWNKVPTERRGACETADCQRCCWDRSGRLETLSYVRAHLKERLVGVDWLPREISMEHKNPAKIMKALSCTIYKPARKILLS